MKTVLFLIPTLTGGGAERVIVTLLRHLDRQRFKLILAVVDCRQAVFREEVPNDVEFIDLGCTRVRQALPKIIGLIWRRRPDVVFSTLSHLNLALAMLRPLLPDKVRYLARETSLVSQNLATMPWSRLWPLAYRFFYSTLDRVICQSEAMREDLVGNFKLPGHKAVVIRNPVDIERLRILAAEPPAEPFSSPAGSIRLVAAGRLSLEKGFDLLLDSLALLNDPRFHLTVLGEGPLRGVLKAQMVALGLGRQVRFLGYQSNPYPYFAQADALVLSSRYEGLPNVVLEALACRTPVIAMPSIGGVKEILADCAGCLLAKEVSAPALAAVLASFIGARRLPENAAAAYALPIILAAYERELLA